MFTTIRKHQRWLMFVIAVLTIIAFAWLYNTTDLERVGTNIVAKIYGRDVMQVDVERSVRNYQLALALGQFQLVRDLSGQAQTEEEAANNFIWNLMILQHESASLGVEPSAQAVVERIKTLPVFQTGGQFDPLKYSEFLQQQLAPRGFTERQLESVIKDSLRLEAVKSLVESPAVVLPVEVEASVERLAPADVEVMRFDAATIAKNISVSEEELQKAYDERRAGLMAPEKRSVRYTAFVLSPEEAELKDRARVEALQKIATATGDFAQAVADSGQSLADAAPTNGFEVQTTPFFNAEGAAGGELKGLEAEVVSAAASMAFRLPSGPGNFEIVALGERGYALIEVAEVQAARPLTLDEARADIRAGLIEQKRDQAVSEAADKVLPELKKQLAEGKTFAEAAKAAGVKSSPMKALSVFTEDLKPEQREVAMSVMDLPVGALGEFVPGPNGGFAAYVVARLQPDADTLAQRRPMLEQGMLQGKQMLLFAQWLVTARDRAGLQILRPMM
jgi:hypothetical protein